MLKKLENLKQRYRELKVQLESPEVLKTPHLHGTLFKELSYLKTIVRLWEDYQKTEEIIKTNRTLLNSEKDSQFLELVKEENQALISRRTQLEAKIKQELLPKDPRDEKNIILEIRAGTGGDEASLFAQDLFEAYHHYSVKKGWQLELISLSPGNIGGCKEVIANIKGRKVYSVLKYESGVHRVQRIPKTESQGRIHTSTVTVVILPEADPLELKIPDGDIRIDVCRSSGAGGQHVNTTDSAVRAIHLPTKIMVYCQQEKSQHANRERALKILYARVWEQHREQQEKNRSQKRQEQMGGGDRSQRIRTYNFPQSRLTDHRIELTLKTLPLIMKGEFDEVFEALRLHYQTQNLLKNEKFEA